MNVHDPRDTQTSPTASGAGIPATPVDTQTKTPNASSNPVASAPEGHRHITTLLMLAGKNGFTDPIALQNFLFKNRDVVTLATELFTSTDPEPVGRNFDQLFPREAIDDYRTQDEGNHPLPGAEPRLCGIRTHMVEIPWNDVTCNLSARYDYLKHILLPAARIHVVEALECLTYPSELQVIPHDYVQELCALADALTKNSTIAAHQPTGVFFEFIQDPSLFSCFTGPAQPDPVPPPYAV